ncbi:MAG: EAL domain-containing protein [Spirochaetaceae bacterium]|nr:EAL domain-containing protein [Spirochaetaceae bacterium]
MSRHDRNSGLVKLTQKFSLKYLIYVMALNSLIMVPYAVCDAIFNTTDQSYLELIFAVIFIALTMIIILYMYKTNKEKYSGLVFTLFFSILWILFLVFINKDNLAIIFFLIYPLVNIILLNYNFALIVNICMYLIYIFLFSFDRQSISWHILNPIAMRVGSLYLMIVITSYFWKKNSFNNLEEMNSLALYDSLTGVANKKHFDSYIENLIPESIKNEYKFSILFIDIDNFKKINDSPGHEVGNKVLQDVASRINRCLDPNDFLFKVGGDEFIAILPEISDDFSPALMASKILAVEDPDLHMPTLSIGIANFPDDGSTKNDLVQKAENAMYKAKKNGKNTFSFSHKEFNELVNKRLLIEKHLRSAVLDKEFSVAFQPKIDPLTEKIIGAEALVRWDNPHLGAVSPAEFISIAEDSDIIHKISTWVYKRAFHMLDKIHKKGYTDLVLSVNVSPLQISKNTLINSVNAALHATGISPEFIELEITEGMLLGTDGNSNETLRYLRQKGFRISIDDFGTGYSSLSYLQKLNLDSIKIDQSFIKDIEQNNAYSITKAIISLAKSLDLLTVAEGVETSAQLKILNDLGCNHIQGFFYSKPLKEKEFMKLLDQNNSL